ncbi:MAG: STAS domain-containing protein [Synergistaceae bacterium]|nr:STAS domain-containing protein [Synergistaceae bacterium]
MNFTTTNDGGKVTIKFEGRLDTVTSPQLEEALVPIIAETKDVAFDFAKLEYLSSAGLRVILSAHKKLKAAGGRLTVANVNSVVKNVFDLTGFSSILNII